MLRVNWWSVKGVNLSVKIANPSSAHGSAILIKAIFLVKIYKFFFVTGFTHIMERERRKRKKKYPYIVSVFDISLGCSRNRGEL